MAKKKLAENTGLQMKIFGGISIILALILGFYLYTNISTYLEMKEQTTSLNNLHSALEETDNRLDTELENNKEGNQELVIAVAEELDYVFPTDEKHTNLTRNIEAFSNDLHRKKDPFLISNLQYGDPKQHEADDYMILPFQMTIHSSHDNFIRFLKYVENSGTLTEKTRLLDIQSIVINFVTPKGSQGNTSGKTEINFNVAMNSYFRKES